MPQVTSRVDQGDGGSQDVATSDCCAGWVADDWLRLIQGEVSGKVQL